MPTTCRTLKVAIRTLVFQHVFSLRRCLTCLPVAIHRPIRSAVHLQSDSSPVAVHLQSICSCAAVPLQSICSSPAVHLPVLLAVHLPVRCLGGLSLLTAKLELPSPSTRVLHQSSILGCCLSHSSTLHRQLTPSCSDDHLHTPTSYSRG